MQFKNGREAHQYDACVFARNGKPVFGTVLDKDPGGLIELIVAPGQTHSLAHLQESDCSQVLDAVHVEDFLADSKTLLG